LKFISVFILVSKAFIENVTQKRKIRQNKTLSAF